MSSALPENPPRLLERPAFAWGVVGLWSLLIWILSGDDFSSTTTSSTLELILGWVLPDLGPDAIAAINKAIRKLMHVFVYGVLGALAVHAGLTSGWRARGAAAVALGWTLAMASADETRQGLEPNRTGSIRDVAVDLGGASLGVAVVITRSRREPKEPTD